MVYSKKKHTKKLDKKKIHDKEDMPYEEMKKDFAVKQLNQIN